MNMPKKALLSAIFALLGLCCLFLFLRESSIIRYIPIAFGLAAFLIGIQKIPFESDKADLLGYLGRTFGLVVCFCAVMLWNENLRHRKEQILQKKVHDRVSLRALDTALQEYYVDWNNYPPNLHTLTLKETYNPPVHWRGTDRMVGEMGPFIDKVPISVFNGLPPRYYALPSIFWMIWYPGPDRKFDIALGPQNKEIDMWIGYGTAMPLWVLNNLYDPTNGDYSAGDIARWSDGAGVEARASSLKQ